MTSKNGAAPENRMAKQPPEIWPTTGPHEVHIIYARANKESRRIGQAEGFALASWIYILLVWLMEFVQ